MTFRFLFTSLLVLLLFAFQGCFGSKWLSKVEYVEGRVTMDGGPLEEASVQFIPKGEGEAAGGYTDADGRYRLSSLNGEPSKGAVEGEYVVLISKIIFVPVPGGQREEGDPEPETAKQITPSIYKNREKTPFSATVSKGKNVFDFDLKSKP